MKIKEIISNNANRFLKQIEDICKEDAYKDVREDSSGFPILRLANDEYYRYKYFERRLEWYTRELLVNPILREMFSLRNIHALWPVENVIYVAFSNEQIEEVRGLEFIVESNDETIGYRYTNISDEDIEFLIKEHNLDRIGIVGWEKYESSEYNRFVNKNDETGYIINLSLKAFFEKYFSKKEYDVFVKDVRKTINIANGIIGFQTIPTLSPRYMSILKQEVLNDLCSTNFEKLRYHIIDREYEKIQSYLDLDGSTFPQKSFGLINNVFKEKEYYRALVGSEEFARCYITAEYLYSILKNEGRFDYTSVVCGYLKAVEQLLYAVLKITLAYSDDGDLYITSKTGKQSDIKGKIKKKKVGNYTYNMIPFVKDNEDYFKLEMGSMNSFLADNDRWRFQEIDKIQFKRYIQCYINECRNEHFHKDNIIDFDEVKIIRDNTKFICFMILGGCKLTDDIVDDYVQLGIEDDEFDRICRAIMRIPLSVNKFVFEYNNGDEKKVIRLYEQESPRYDMNGGIVDSKLKFIVVEDFKIHDYEQIVEKAKIENRIICLQKNNIPEKIYYYTYTDKKVPVEW